MNATALFEEIIRRYAQEQETVLDPTQLQVGQSVYSPEGDEFMVLENAPDTTNVVLMPADQTGSPVPEGVQTVENPELATTYALQPQTGVTARVKAVIRKLKEKDKDDSGKEWGLYTSDGKKLLGRHPSEESARQQEEAIKAKGGSRLWAGYFDEDDPTFDDPPPEKDRTRAPGFALDSPQDPEFPEWAPGSGNPRVPRYDPMTYSQDTQTVAPQPSGPLMPNENPPRSERPLTRHLTRGGKLHADISDLAPYRESGSPLEEGPGWGNEEDALRIGESGYTEVMGDIRAMVDAGYSTIDVVLNIGELYPRDLGERVLSEARKKGIL